MADHRDEEFSESGDHGSVQDDGDTQQQRRLAHSRPASSQITLQDLEKYYDVPLTEVAKKLNISITMLKKLCRKFGINRWPHRQIRSINNTISALQEQLATCQTEDERARIEEQIESMKRKRRLVCRSASCGLNAALRNAIFLARPGELDEEVLFEQGLLPNLQAAMTHKIKAESSQRVTTTDTSAFPLNELEAAGMGHVNKYRATNRRERAGTAATLPYGPAMVMPNAGPPLAPLPSHFGDGGDHFDYRSMHQQFGGLPGAAPGQYPVGSASLQQHLMQHYNRNPGASLDTFSPTQMPGRAHPLGGLPPSSMLSDQAPTGMKSGAQMSQGFAPYGSQASQQLQNEQALLQWQMMQHNTPTGNFPSLSMYSQGGQSSAAAAAAAATAAGQSLGGTSAASANDTSGATTANAPPGGGNAPGGVGGGNTSVTGEGPSSYQSMADAASAAENLKRMYGLGAYDPRAQQSAAASGAGGGGGHNQDQYSDMPGQDYMRQGYRPNDGFENLGYPQGLGGAGYFSSQYPDYRSRELGQPQGQPSRGDMMREASDFSGYNITI